MAVFVRSNIAKFGQNAQFSKKIFCLLLKMTMTKIMRNESIMVQRRKSSRIKWCINFKNILIRTRDIAIIRMAYSSEAHNQTRPVLSIAIKIENSINHIGVTLHPLTYLN